MRIEGKKKKSAWIWLGIGALGALLNRIRGGLLDIPGGKISMLKTGMGVKVKYAGSDKLDLCVVFKSRYMGKHRALLVDATRNETLFWATCRALLQKSGQLYQDSKSQIVETFKPNQKQLRQAWKNLKNSQYNKINLIGEYPLGEKKGEKDAL